jgi:hypothetical protein
LKPVTNLGQRRLAADRYWGLCGQPSPEIVAIGPPILAIFKLDDRANEGIAPSLDVCDVSIAELAVAKRLADGGNVDSKTPFFNGTFDQT